MILAGQTGQARRYKKKKEEEGDVSVDKRIHYFFSFSLGGLQKVRANCEGSGRVFMSSLRGPPSCLTPVRRVSERREWRVRRSEEETNSWHRTSWRASDRRRPLLSRRVVPPAAPRESVYYRVSHPPLPVLLPPLIILLLLPPLGCCSSFSSSTSITASLPLGSLSNREQESPGEAARCQ